MIVVVGRPGLDANDKLDRPAGLVALACARAGARVELVGAIGDDPAGDRLVLALGKARIGHAAILRDPAAVTPRAAGPAGPLPRLDAQDVELGLSYLADYTVLIVADPVADATLAAAAAAATYQGAALVAVVAPDTSAPADLPSTATVLELPSDDEGLQPFAALIGRYAAELDGGAGASAAWQAALAAAGWDRAEEGAVE